MTTEKLSPKHTKTFWHWFSYTVCMVMLPCIFALILAMMVKRDLAEPRVRIDPGGVGFPAYVKNNNMLCWYPKGIDEFDETCVRLGAEVPERLRKRP